MDTVTPDVVEDVDLRQLLESLDGPRCEWDATGPGYAGKIGMPCDSAPTWLMVVSCGCSAYLCQGHAERTRKRLDPTPLGVFCTRHDRRVTVEWRPL